MISPGLRTIRELSAKTKCFQDSLMAIGAWVLDGTEELVGKPGLEAL
jgi:hypothetical protein